MQLEAIRNFMRTNMLAVQASVAPDGSPQAAVIGIVVDDDGSVFFDTLTSSRKCKNLRADPRIALVVGWDLEQGRTVQLEGIADEPTGDELARLQQLYFASFPDGIERKALPDITYFRVRPTWLRDSDFGQQPPAIVEHDFALLGDDEANAFARAHVDVWNTHDLDAILDDYTADATLSSPVAKALTGAATIRGHAALREYFATAFAKYPDLRFDLHHTFRGEHGVTLLFRGAGGRMVAEVLRLDRNRKITSVDAHYAC